MKVTSYREPKSSFLSMEKDLAIIIDKILANTRLKKLLHYESRDALTKPPLNEDQSLDLIGKKIKIIPKLTVDKEAVTYLVISFDNFIPNNTNPEFRDCKIIFNILCHPDHWNMGNFALRPYKIAGEIDGMLAD